MAGNRAARHQWQPTNLHRRVVDIVFGVILLILAGVIEHMCGGFGIVVACFSPPAGVQILWHVAELITVVLSKGEDALPARAHMGVHFLISVGWLSAVCAMFLTGTMDNFSYYRDYYGGAYPTTWVLLIFAVMSMILNFTLFTAAWRERGEDNSSGRWMPLATHR